MSPLAEELTRVFLIGVGATAALDLWLLLQQRFKMPTMDFALLGRWVGHVARGRWAHKAIVRAAPIRGERMLGWLTHYAVGIGFAGLLVVLQGPDWSHSANLAAALCVGIVSVLAPWFVMQPAMGAGFASAKTRTPLKNCARSLANHAVFGAGLYLAALGVAGIWR